MTGPARSTKIRGARVRSVSTGGTGVVQEVTSGWVSVLWDDAHPLTGFRGPVDYHAPFARGVLVRA